MDNEYLRDMVNQAHVFTWKAYNPHLESAVVLLRFTQGFVFEYIQDLGYTKAQAEAWHRRVYAQALPLLDTAYERKLDKLRAAYKGN